MAALVLAAVAVFGWWWYNSQYPAGEQKQEETQGTVEPKTEVTIEGGEYYFSPSLITVAKGKKITVTFKNVGSIAHTYTINELNLDTGLVNPGDSKTLEFDAPDATGSITFESICTVFGHKELGMRGTLKVE